MNHCQDLLGCMCQFQRSGGDQLGLRFELCSFDTEGRLYIVFHIFCQLWPPFLACSKLSSLAAPRCPAHELSL